MARPARATPPQLLPKGCWGDMFRRWMPAASEEQTGNVIKGIGGSIGTITAPARVLGGPHDFGQMQPGDVLVASITTPAWTSLFAMASGVVTDIGGPLSHSSIVAREYGIPAVLGTAVATRLIHSGQLIDRRRRRGVRSSCSTGGRGGQEEPSPPQQGLQPLIIEEVACRREVTVQLAFAGADAPAEPALTAVLCTAGPPQRQKTSLLSSTSSAMRLPISNEAVAAGDGAFSTWT